MKTVYFDCFSGAGGDMLVAALVDAGVPLARIAAALDGLSVSGFRVDAEKIAHQGFAATRFTVTTDETPNIHRGLADIREILSTSTLPEPVKARSLATFERLAAAEAEAHGVPVERVHFHEVGAVDAIVDVVAVVFALHDLGAEKILASPLVVGGGTVRCAHGVMPVPAPATALLLRNVPIQPSAEQVELLTPTAAALLTTLCSSFGPLPAMTVAQIGAGAGTHVTKGPPNIVRVLVGDAPDEAPVADTVTVLEANLDDAPGEWIGHCLQCLRDAGALDAWCVPIHMKKDRPGVVLTVICAPQDRPALEALIFRETTTFGVRHYQAQRHVLARSVESVTTSYGDVRVKIGREAGRVVQVAPEFEDCAAAARTHDAALRDVMEAARRQWMAQADPVAESPDAVDKSTPR